MRDKSVQAGRETLDLGSPVGQQRRRRHQQAGPLRIGLLRLAHQQQREHLDGLAQSHVVGEAGAQTQFRQEVQPAHADLLIRAQVSVQGACLCKGKTIPGARAVAGARDGASQSATAQLGGAGVVAGQLGCRDGRLRAQPEYRVRCRKALPAERIHNLLIHQLRLATPRTVRPRPPQPGRRAAHWLSLNARIRLALRSRITSPNLWSIYDPRLFSWQGALFIYAKSLENRPRYSTCVRAGGRVLRRLKTDKSPSRSWPRTEVKAYCPLSRKQGAPVHSYASWPSAVLDQTEECAQGLGVLQPHASQAEPNAQTIRHMCGWAHGRIVGAPTRHRRIIVAFQFPVFREMTEPLSLPRRSGRPGLISARREDPPCARALCESATLPLLRAVGRSRTCNASATHTGGPVRIGQTSMVHKLVPAPSESNGRPWPTIPEGGGEINLTDWTTPSC